MLDRPRARHSVLNRPRALSLSQHTHLSFLFTRSLAIFLCLAHLTHLIGLAVPPCLRSFILFNSIFLLLLATAYFCFVIARPFLRALLLRYTNTYAHRHRHKHTNAACGFALGWRLPASMPYTQRRWVTRQHPCKFITTCFLAYLHTY